MAKDFNLDLDNMEIDGSDNDVDAPISSDNIGDESWDLIDNDSNFFNATELDLPEGSIESEIFDIISDHNGVINSLLPPCFLRLISATFVSFSPFFCSYLQLTIDEIILSVSCETSYRVVQAVQHPESSFLINQRNSQYFKL